jgi:hypothetical protein
MKVRKDRETEFEKIKLKYVLYNLVVFDVKDEI